MNNPWDPYELRARIAPTVIVFLPLGITGVALTSLVPQSFTQFPQILGSGIVILILLYLGSFLIRQNGLRIQSGLWDGWGGPPSTRLMRWRDPFFGDDTKQQIHLAINRICGINLLSKKEEAQDNQKADLIISEAYHQVMTLVRKYDKGGMWSTHNAEYGFLRNLLGSRTLWLVLSLFGLLICAIGLYFFPNIAFLSGVIINALLTIAVFVFGWFMLAKLVKVAADRYAESVWKMFLAIANTEKIKE